MIRGASNAKRRTGLCARWYARSTVAGRPESRTSRRLLQELMALWRGTRLSCPKVADGTDALHCIGLGIIMSVLFFSRRFLAFHFRHFLGEISGEFFVLDIIHGERAEHVVRVVPGPILFRIVVSHFRGLPLPVFVMDRVGAGWVHDLGRTAHAAFDQVTMKSSILPDGNLMFFPLNLSGDWDITNFGFHRRTRLQNRPADRFKRFALIRIRFVVDVYIGELPVSVGIH